MPRQRYLEPNYRLWRDAATGLYYIRYTDERRISRSVSTRTRDTVAAEAFRDQFIAGRQAPLRPIEPTIGHLLDRYLADRAGHTASTGHEWACQAIRRHIGNLRPEHLDRRTYWLKRAKDGVGPGTIIKEVGHLRAALANAIKDKLIAAAPEIDRPSQPKAREIWISKEQAVALRRGAVMPHVRLFIVLATATAGRKEAIERLSWDRVDLTRGIVHLALPGRPSSKKRAAVVPISPAVVRYLKQHKAIAITNNVLEWRGKPAGSVRKGLAAAVKRAGLGKEITAHVLRHSAASWMVEAGVPTAQVARFLGDTEAMVERVYGHHRPSYLRDAAAALTLSRRTPSQTTPGPKR